MKESLFDLLDYREKKIKNIFYIIVASMEYFYYLCCRQFINNIIMRNSNLQLSLFSSGWEFDKEAFERDVLTDTFKDCIRKGVLHGFNKSRDHCSVGNYTLRLNSSYMQESAFREIEEEFKHAMPDTDIRFIFTPSGSDRLFFTFNGYVFLLNKIDSSGNDNSQSDSIRMQRGQMPIMSILYRLDDLRENVAAIYIQFKRNGCVEYNYSLDMSSFEHEETTVNNAEKKHLSLKIDKEAAL